MPINTVGIGITLGSDPLGIEDKCIAIPVVGGVLYLHGTYQEMRDFALAIAAEANRAETQQDAGKVQGS